ncbi:acyltransferase family protein [Yoonia maritima]|uniref:acyltransferase family protein n=1 Tax=Yoonia maritima TaxID=1435347 RepID=UPI000D102291|nr:acyltransferase [Yoonia maritima]
MTQSGQRLLVLDGFRAIAIISVLFYHYFQRFPNYYPYGASLFQWSHEGYVGVHFFFIISGFVIALTLEKTTSWMSFFLRRVFRLLPPLTIAALVSYFVIWGLGRNLTPEISRQPLDFIPSLTMTSPSLWRWLDPSITYIDGAYWSLYAEVRFYLIAAAIYYCAPRRITLDYILVALSLFAAIGQLSQFSAGIRTITEHLLIAPYLHYFAAGTLFFRVWRGTGQITVWICILVMLLTAIFSSSSPEARMIDVIMFTGFALLVKQPKVLMPLTFAPLVWIGQISYSIYLLHQMIGVILIAHIPINWPIWGQLLSVGVVTALIVTLSAALHSNVEKQSTAMARKVEGWIASK